MRLTKEGCRIRQKRLFSEMEHHGMNLVVLGNPRHVLYFSGYETSAFHSSALIFRENGHCVLIAPETDQKYSADEFRSYEPAFLSTLRSDIESAVAALVRDTIGKGSFLIGLDREGSSAHLGDLSDQIFDLTSLLYELRRKKDPDELQLIQKAINVSEVCYQRVREIIQPGISELEMYADLYETAVLVAGERLPAIGNDFQCGTPGGLPRRRKIEEGELYILDLGIELGGYHSDNCRTFSVDGRTSKLQLKAWNMIIEIFERVEDLIKPDVSCRDLYQEIKNTLDRDWPGAFSHHLGHGIGLQPHERPYLNPNWNHFFQEGDVFTVEPGVYSDDLKGGIRIEEDYLITADGFEKLTSAPRDL